MVVIIVSLFFFFFSFHGKITGFFRIGTIIHHSPLLDDRNVLLYEGAGYDGQMFLSLALDPLLRDERTKQCFDNLRYRYRRILFPLFGYIGGLGNPDIIPYALVLVNGLALILTAFLARFYLKRYPGGLNEGFLALCIPGIWISYMLSTADALCGMFLCSAVFSYSRGKPVTTSLALMAACLTRETMLIVWFAFLIVSLMEGKRAFMLHLMWACMPAIFWNGYVLISIPVQIGTLGSELLSFPFSGIYEKMLLLAGERFSLLHFYDAVSFILLMCVAVLLVSRENWRNDRLIFVISSSFLLLLSISSIKVIRYFDGYNRVFLYFYLLLLLSRPSFLKKVCFSLAGILSFGYLIAVYMTPALP
jgi:hypothetical protein